MKTSIFLLFSLGSFSALAGEVDPGWAAKTTQCLQAELSGTGGTEPTASNLHLGDEWVCQRLAYFRGNETHPNGIITVIRPEEDMNPYLFGLQGRRVINQKRKKPGTDESVLYLGFDSPSGLEGMLSLWFGIKNGFYRDFIRLSARGELISETSILESDLSYFPVSPSAPSALTTERNLVHTYGVCRLKKEWNPGQNFTCFEGYGRTIP